jgi:hypothetical protein
METANNDNEVFPLPPVLLLKVQAAAEEEHRPTKDIVREAVERYLESRPHHVNAVSTVAAEKGRTFEAWARSHPDTPPLPDETIRRENLVRDALK